MAEIHHNQIKARLLEQIAPHIDVSDIVTSDELAFERAKLSRCVAAAAVMIAAEIDNEAASQTVVDGAKDNGIDAIYYQSQTKTLYLVQSKWSDSTNSSIDLAGVLKFIAGVQDLISKKREAFGEKVLARWTIISDALDKASSVKLILAFPGSGKIAPDIQQRLDEYVELQNDTSDMFFHVTISQRELFQYFAREAAPPKIDITITVQHYGMVEAPLKAVYGQVAAHDVGAWWKKHGNALFSGNIRHFLGLRSEVNAAISETLTQSPHNLWYFNNGITLLTESLIRRPGTADRSVGVFECKNVTVVNGAQTVGTIGRANVAADSPAVLNARIIMVDDPESSIGREITRASNTQNKIDARNFVALDPEQERIRTELLLDNVAYEFREGEPLDSLVDGFEFIEAIVTLACASTEISYVALAKGYVGGLYAHIESAPYKALFNPSTSARHLWNLVQFARRFDKSMKNAYDSGSSIEPGIVVHGNRLSLHCALRYLGKGHSIEEGHEIADGTLDNCATMILHGIRDIIDADFTGAYLAPLFKNVTKCTAIRKKLEETISP